MRPISQKVNGVLYEKEGETALLLDDAAAPLFLRYAFVIQGPEDPIFPAFLLDDWGREIGKLALYQWVAENGNLFPRAEIFGYELDGRETQVFLRALELYARYPCYVYPDKDAPVERGRLLRHILIPEAIAATPAKTKRPDNPHLPLARARLSWWHINPAHLFENGYQKV
ncbi:MAG: hypothetical protein KJ063_04175 [Anaerolineae bacterium]|nr:hypothetical protein [Anaerolineae bacterium]